MIKKRKNIIENNRKTAGLYFVLIILVAFIFYFNLQNSNISGNAISLKDINLKETYSSFPVLILTILLIILAIIIIIILSSSKNKERERKNYVRNLATESDQEKRFGFQ